jgi:voltage-gated potassium channel Kch
MTRIYRSIFLFLLTALLLLLVVQPEVTTLPRGQIVLSVLNSLLQIAAILVLAEDRRLRVFAWVLGLPPLIAIWSRHYVSESAHEMALVWSHALTCVFMAGIAVLILRYVMTHNITADSVVAAICAYLLIGVVAGHLCFIVETLEPGAYHTADNVAAEMTNPDARSALFVYYSFSTLTTTGYGDIVPARPLTRTLSWLEAATGQLYLAVLIAGVVSMRVSQKMGVGVGGGRPHEPDSLSQRL